LILKLKTLDPIMKAESAKLWIRWLRRWATFTGPLNPNPKP